jgi:hypothetical protein
VLHLPLTRAIVALAPLALTARPDLSIALRDIAAIAIES